LDRVARNPSPYFIISSETPLNLEDQVPIFISPGNRVAQLYPRALGSLYVASYDSQGHSGGILTRLRFVKLVTEIMSLAREQAYFIGYFPYLGDINGNSKDQIVV
jgi:hypothetical protein